MSGAPAWTTTETATLRQLWCVEGRTIADITKLTGKTDWSIRGKIRYEGWPLPKSKRVAAANRGIKARLDRFRQPGPVDLKPNNKKALVGRAWRALPGSDPVSLVDLEPGMCKWPIGNDSPYRFCGQSSGEATYCAHHARLSVGKGTETERTAHRAREKVPA